MAQVRKFNTGGKTFKINGQTLNTSNAEDMKRLQDMIGDANHGGFAQFVLDSVNDSDYAGDLDVSLTADGKVNVIGGTQAARDKHLSNKAQRAASNPKKLIKGRDYRNASDSAHSFVKAFGSAPTTPTEDTSNKIRLTGVGDLGGKWAYDANGLWNEADINNATMLKRWNDLRDYITGGEENKKRYDVSGLNKDRLTALEEMYKTNKELFNQYNSYFTKDASKLSEDSDFYSTFGWYGFNAGTPEEIAAAKSTRDLAAKKAKLKALGSEYDFDGNEEVFDFDKDGNLVVTDAFLNAFGVGPKGTYWFNDDWAQMKGNDGRINPYSGLKGHIVRDGRIYKDSDASIQQLLSQEGYMDANKRYDANAADKIMKTYWTQNPMFGQQAYDPTKYYSEWANGLEGLRYRTLGYNVGDDNQLVEYYLDSDPTDAFGYRTSRYAIVGKDGKLVQDNVNLSDYEKIGDGSAVDSVFMQDILDNTNGKLSGTYLERSKNADGTAADWYTRHDPKTGDLFLHSSDLKGNQRGKVIQIPSEIAQHLSKETLDYFKNNKDAKDRFFSYIREWTSSGVGEYFRKSFGWATPINMARKAMLVNDFVKTGMDRTKAQEVVDLLIEYGNNKKFKEHTGKSDASKASRYSSFVSEEREDDKKENVTVNRNGGVIEKHQLGNTLGGRSNVKSKQFSITQSSGNEANFNQSIGFGSKDSKQWSSLDTAELMALIGDAASLGISFVPGAHFGAAGVGAAASTTNFVTDIKRDGFQGRDLLNYGVNLGFDALSAFTGAGGKMAKFAKNFPTAAKLLQKAFKAGAIAGVSDAVINSVNKIANGESFTMSDVRRIMNGVAGGVTLSKTGLFSPGKVKKTITPELTVKGKAQGTADVKLTDTELAKIAEKPEKERFKALLETLSQKTGKQTSELRDLYNLDDLLKKTKSFQWKFWKGRKESSVLDLPESETKRVSQSEAELDAKARERNAFQNWFFGTGKTQRAYNNWAATGGQPKFNQEIKVKGQPYIEQGYKPAIDIPEGSGPGLVPMEYYAKEVVPTTTVLSKHKSPFKGWWFTSQPAPNIVSTTEIPEETYYAPEHDAYAVNRSTYRPIHKEGGVLKANTGLKFDFKPIDIPGVKPTFKPKLDLKTDLLDPNYKPIQSVGERIVSQVITGTTPTKGTMYDWKGQSYNPAEVKSTVSTPTTKSITDRRLDTLSFDRKNTGNFDWNYALKEGLGFANTLGAISDAKKFREQSNKKADVFASGQPSVWSGRGRTRFQTLTDNQTNQEIAANNTAANMFNTSDSALNLAGKLGIAQTNAALRNQGNRLLSQEYSNALNQHAVTQREDDKLAFETGNRARQYAAQAGLMRVAGDTEYTTNMGAIRDKYFNKLQSDINRFGLMDVSKQNKIDQLNLMKNLPGVTADQIKQIDAQIAMINSPEYSNILRRQAMYGTTSAKKGAKLRSVSEQMLLDNNKLVAKAIEKLNDNTTKLILKALS